MIVSNYELLIKRIATVPTSTPASISSVFRRVVQGYFLMITNLEEDRSISLSLKLTIPTSSGNRVMSNLNTQIFYDNGTINNTPLSLNQLNPINANHTEYRTSSFNLGPRRTALVTILPNVIPFINSPMPDLEIRGYVELFQRRVFPRGFFTETPEAKVLVSPETRGTFLDNDYPTMSTSNELDFDQISYGLPIASGKNLNVLESVPPILLPPPLDFNDIATLRQSIQSKNPDLDSEELDIVTNNFFSMKGNKELEKLLKSINK